MKGDNYIYKEKSYDYYNFLTKAKTIKYAIFLILEQNIYIRKLKVDLKKINEKEINKMKELEFGKEKEYLIHYEVNKKEKSLYMYAVSGGGRIAGAARYFKELEVIPIQLKVKKTLEKRIKDKNYGCLFFYEGIYYYFEVNNGYMMKCYIWKDLSDILEFFQDIDKEIALYVQSGLNIKGDNVIFISFREVCNEKILFK